MRMPRGPLVAALAVVALAACSSGKNSTTATTVAGSTTKAGANTTLVGDATTTVAASLPQFVYQPDGFCQAFRNFVTYGTVVVGPFVAVPSDSSTTVDAATGDTRQGAAALAFALSIAPTNQVLHGDAPEELAAPFREFDAYNTQAVAALKALGVDTDKLGATVAGELNTVDPQTPANIPDSNSIAKEAGIDSTKLDAAATSFVKDHGTLATLFEKYNGLSLPAGARGQELITKYPCLSALIGGG
jgi:hypothetical protein